jgi:hypothetical protein
MVSVFILSSVMDQTDRPGASAVGGIEPPRKSPAGESLDRRFLTGPEGPGR